MTVECWRTFGPRLLPPRLRFQRARQRRNPRLVVGQAVLRMNACHDPAGFSVTPTRRPSTKISTHAYHRGRKRGKHSIAEIENDILIIFDRARRMQYDITKYSLEPHQYAQEPHCRTPTCSRRTTKTVAIQCDVFLVYYPALSVMANSLWIPDIFDVWPDYRLLYDCTSTLQLSPASRRTLQCMSG